MKKVLFACVHNAGRSQMAAAWFNALSEPSQVRGISAGTAPGVRVHPEVVEAMREVGIDLAAQQPTFLSDALAQEAALLITMGCGEACPAVPGLRRLDWPLEDPKGKPLERVREIRTEVRGHVLRLVTEQGWARAVDLQPLRDADLPAVRTLLEQHRLPTQGVTAGDSFGVAWAGGRMIGSIGVEPYAQAGLLRSLVVESAQQKTGVASALVQRAVQQAEQAGMKALYLLTTTAPGFFEKHGFVRCPRSEAPPGIRESWEFRTGCPDSAVFMRRWLSE
jgi:protein-tyrosine-phosphatase/N-acetylglutamate synthase-like GNAT family acetyltransferase